MFRKIVVLFAIVCMMACSVPEKPVKFAIVSDLHAVDVPDGKEQLDSFITAASRAGWIILLNWEISILLCWMEITCLAEKSIVTIQKQTII